VSMSGPLRGRQVFVASTLSFREVLVLEGFGHEIAGVWLCITVPSSQHGAGAMQQRLS
jgi:hypothetical protein